MPGSDGFQYDLWELSKCADNDIPFIEQMCSFAQSTLQVTARDDGTIFELNASSGLYLGLSSSFVEAGADLANLMSMMTFSLEECAKALREAVKRYQAAEQQNTANSNEVGSTL